MYECMCVVCDCEDLCVVVCYVAKRRGARFNILWANTSVQEPAILSAVPKPVIRRRFFNPDEVSKEVSKVLERGIEFQTDPGNGSDFDDFMVRFIKDFQLGGRAVPRIRLVPTIRKTRVDLHEDENGAVVRDNKPVQNFERDDKGPFTTESELLFMEVEFEETDFEFFRMQPARNWSSVKWVAFGETYDKAEFQHEFRIKSEEANFSCADGPEAAFRMSCPPTPYRNSWKS